jgi:hypothetical protein
MFVSYKAIGSQEMTNSDPILLKGETEWAASAEASAKADSLFPSSASEVVIRVVGGHSGQTIAEIRRPISN